MKSMGYLSISLVAAFPYLFNYLSIDNDFSTTERGEKGLDTRQDLPSSDAANPRKREVAARKDTDRNSTDRPLPGDVCLFSSFNGNEIQARECGSGHYSSQELGELIGADDRQHALRSTVQVERARSESLEVCEGRLA
ncbi:hypothetical protein ACNFG0_17470 [Pseudomonas sp. NY15372]|uniref:hypothetical protein n=1 Tax=Pseudomonas sp. NY15372 TaxID=3400356 RepID=UPI003A8BF22A